MSTRPRVRFTPSIGSHHRIAAEVRVVDWTLPTPRESSMSSTAPSAVPPRFAGLDGLRAIAVTLVVTYHLFAPVLPGGFIGVDVFFVISGFLITSLLLREHGATDRIRIGEFWRRRARRLLPALALVLTVCATAAWFIGGDVLVGLGTQLLGAATFSYNWLSISAGSGYFSDSTPELFRNVWSLAVEEQFYVLWPLLLPLFLLIPRAWGRAGATLLLAGASAAWMAVVVASGDDTTRAYFGTDTHSFGILLGVALAFALPAMLRRAAPLTGATRAAVTGLGAAAVTGLVGIALIAAGTGAATFPGVLVAASVLTVVAITASVWPGSTFGTRIDARPLRWIGDRSYGIYLWHWPLLVLVVAAAQGTAPAAGVPAWLSLMVLLLTLVLAELSYRCVEMPVRRLGFRGSLRALRMLVTGGPSGRIRALGLTAAVALVLGGTSAAIAAAPIQTSSETVVAEGRAALQKAQEATPDTTPSATPTPTATETTAAPTPPPTAGRFASIPSPTPVMRHVPGSEITAVGDSVMLASAKGLLEKLPGIQIDAEVSRSIWAGPDILERLASAGALRPYVVVALGTNGPVDTGVLEQMLKIVGPDRQLVLVNAYAPRDWIAGVNNDLAAFARSHPRVGVADWSGAISSKTELLAGDRIHPGDAGGRVFARAVSTAVEKMENMRARATYAHELARYENYQRRLERLAQ